MNLFLLQGRVKCSKLDGMRHAKPHFLILTLALLWVATPTSLGRAASESQSPLWEEIRALDQRGDIKGAINAMHQHPQDHAFYFYNLGTLYYRAGDFGPAVAYLEKANRKKPHDPDIRHNLQMARTELAKLIGRDKLDPASNWIEDLSDPIPLDEVRAVLGLVALMLMVFWIRKYRKTRVLSETLAHPAGILGILAFALTAALYFAQRESERTPPAVSLQTQIVRRGPGEEFLEIGRVESGMKIRMRGASETSRGNPELWSQIEFGEDQVGWVRASGLLLL